MNLADLERMVRSLWSGEDAERVMGVVRLAWESGQRSGGALARRPSGNVTWEEWDWSDVQIGELLAYTEELLGGGLFGPAPIDVVTGAMEDARLWATSKGARRKNWTTFMQGWIRREVKGRSLTPSPTSSVASGSRQTERQQSRANQALRILGQSARH